MHLSHPRSTFVGPKCVHLIAPLFGSVNALTTFLSHAFFVFSLEVNLKSLPVSQLTDLINCIIIKLKDTSSTDTDARQTSCHTDI